MALFQDLKRRMRLEIGAQPSDSVVDPGTVCLAAGTDEQAEAFLHAEDGRPIVRKGDGHGRQ
ncbi:MAG: hypothetical protein E5Y61_13325 [Mesorhizobium sp.]|nr:MAG: hypothetical protein E5Y61_13325 [Mesorhizobium sp.]